MMKLVKIVLGVVAVAVLLVVAAVLTMPLWVGPVLRPAVVAAAPKITGTQFKLDKLCVNPYTGRVELGGFMLGNPEGYDEPVAVSVGTLVFDAAVTTVCDEYLHIEEVTVEDVFASYLTGGPNKVDNFKQIQYNVAGGKEKYEKAQEKAKTEAEKAKAKADEEATEAIEEAADRKVVIDRLAVRRVKVRLGPLTVPVPVDIVLTDLGKKSDGMKLSEVFEEVWAAILKSVGSVGEGVKALGGLVGDGAAAAGEGAAKAASAAADVVGDGAAAVGDGAVKAAGAVGDGAAKAASAVGDVVGEGASKAVDTVGEGAKKAADAVKGLFDF